MSPVYTQNQSSEKISIFSKTGLDMQENSAILLETLTPNRKENTMSLNSTIFTATYIKYTDNNGTPRLGFIVNNQGDGTLTVGRLSDTDYFDREALENNVDGCIMHGIPFIDSTDVFEFEIIHVKQVTEVNPEWD